MTNQTHNRRRPIIPLLPSCERLRLAARLDAELRDVLESLLKEIESLNERIKEYDERMEKIAKES
jgi:hypothetical protein